MMPTSTAADIAVDALIALAKAALPNLQVLDGPYAGEEPNDDVLIVGYSDGQSPSIVLSRGEPDLCGRQREEGDIVCLLSSWSGQVGNPMKAPRDRCKTAITALQSALAGSPGLAGAVDGAWLGEDAEWVQRQSKKGALCRVAFSVHYVAQL